ncbi:MAG TPA: MFS transporter [Anaerolineaceae bacterium]|nr:MFS transporter [Anaerolineaceae bacterium]
MSVQDDQTPPEPTKKPISMGGQVFLFALVRMIININTRMVYPFLNSFSSGLGVDLVTISLAMTVRSISGAISLFLTPLADRHGRKAGMLLGIAIFILGALLVVIWPGFLTFTISISLTFLGMFVYLSSTQAYISDHVRAGWRGTALGLVETGWGISFILGMPILGWLIDRYGWKAPFPFTAVLSGIAFLLVWILVPSHKPAQAPSRSVLQSIWEVLNVPAARWGLLMSLMLISSNEVINLVFGVWLEVSFGLKLAALGAASAVIGISEISGESIGGVFSDRLGRARSIMLGMGLMLVVAAALPFIGGSQAGALIGLFFFYLSYEFTFVSTLPFMTELVPQFRGTLLGANVASLSLGRMIGNLVAPFVFTIGFWANALAAVFFILVAFWALLQAKKPRPAE